MGNDFFDGLSETITRTAKEFGERAEGLYEAQKLRSRISGEERLAEKAKADLGNLIYQRYESGESMDDEIAALCEEITQHQKKIHELKKKAAGKRGQKLCPSCHKAVDQEVAFCPYCGTPCQSPKTEEKEPENGEACEEECGPQEECTQECGECTQEPVCEEGCAAEDEEHPSQDAAVEEESVEEAVREAPVEEFAEETEEKTEV